MKGEFILVDSEAYNSMIKDLRKIIEENIRRALETQSTENDWLNSEEAMQVLRISTKATLRKMRIAHSLKHTKSGNGLLYSKKALLEYLEQNSRTIL